MAIALIALALASATMPGTHLSDPELATLRGGFRLPTGIDVSLAVQTDTAVNGALLLRSVFVADHGTPTLQVFAPAAGTEVVSTTHAADAASSGGVSVQFDRQNGVVFVPATTATPAVSVSTGSTMPNDAASAGLSAVPVSVGSAPVETAGGAVSVEALPDGERVRLEGAGLDVSHVVGAAFGSVLANNANDRVIDTTTTISLDLTHVGPEALGSTMFKVENVAVEAAQLGVR